MRSKSKCIKYLFTVFLLLSTLNVNSQQGTINYELTIQDKILGSKRIQKLIIYFNKFSSLEQIIKPPIILKNSSDDDLNQIKVIKVSKPYFIYKNFLHRQLLLSDYIGVKKRLITDTLNNFRWKIIKENQKIGKFNCKKATTFFRGRNYEAWYTEDVPISNGPWKFCGLPGLIIKVKDLKSDFVYELSGINLKAKFDENIVSLPAVYGKEKAITYSYFRYLYKLKLEDYLKLSRIDQTTPDGVSGTVSIRLPEMQEKF